MTDDRLGKGPDEGMDGGLDDLLRILEEERTGEATGPRAVDGEGPGGVDDGGAHPWRRDLELLGLLAWELEERPPAPELKERLMAAVRAGASARPAPLRPPAWLTTLAAALLLAVVGLAVFSGWLYSRIDQQEEVIARLSRQLEATAGEAERLANTRADLEQTRLHLASRLSLVATPGTEVCPLRPVGRQPIAPDARGLLFLSGPRDEWYVRVANVEPAPEGRTYRLWFLLGDEFRPAGVLHPGIDGAIELAGSRLPPEDRMTAALVTLEPAARTPARPTGPTVLYGDEKMDMI